ncbi:MAG: D-tyrosyl-tRNA(Tyr) deacylase [Elusimicrobia bacterium CG1_02_63_36]|nr:MAG: D-tyrosyl-tRNA(Tyr) deacylase [Elusimicrobia bacterium CG1_02_63_36]PIP84217.1 MAG: D-tyrosyl-tRNA(Tyr) deacylase [Elusimicrobia bacterium CG22_combo_CG10-13_8_21_14_all_63_91]PJA17112.1 MAG: D-tyrosyl-tRNA(Tyr) deacylase [Elusimicrobia bacterium CG_4_10_14_0_2_um_filter_63_34]PJB26629.1 MAG: D-tyrosyl-tRNA(Tyr) deacylase [Elusimicrobia bacterium CG_4_9_14_3_um_filter_62_55]
MRVLIQRVSDAAVRVEGGAPRSIGPGLVLLIGVGPDDNEAVADRIAEKAANLRIFSNDAGKFDKSLLDTGGGALVVSQFTLYGDCRKGRRPDFTGAASPERAEPLYRRFIEALRGLGVSVQTGEFGASMEVELRNNGPVSVWIDSETA